jgi:hypothetical protein
MGFPYTRHRRRGGESPKGVNRLFRYIGYADLDIPMVVPIDGIARRPEGNISLSSTQQKGEHVQIRGGDYDTHKLEVHEYHDL